MTIHTAVIAFETCETLTSERLCVQKKDKHFTRENDPLLTFKKSA